MTVHTPRARANKKNKGGEGGGIHLQSVLAIYTCLASGTLRPFSTTWALRTCVTLVSLGATRAYDSRSALSTSVTLISF